MRIVIKIGTSTLAHPSGHLNIRRTEQLCKTISDIKNAGNQVKDLAGKAIKAQQTRRRKPCSKPGKFSHFLPPL